MVELQARGVKITYVILHVGLDPFVSVMEANPEEHKFHTEGCELPQETADVINQTKHAGSMVIAVGNTSVRTLESAANAGRDPILPAAGSTSLFNLPGFQFNIVDAMITNFDLPKSTLLMLFSVFAGREKILETYQTAVREG